MIRYRSGYKYQLAKTYSIRLKYNPMVQYEDQFLCVDLGGNLTVKSGYAWNGASGPTFDSKNSMRPTLIHDAIYQLIRHGIIPQSFRRKADRILYQDLRDDGMSWIRAKIWYCSVRKFGHNSANKSNIKKVMTAP